MKIGNLLFEAVELLNEANVFNVKTKYNDVSLQSYLAQFEQGLSTPEGKAVFTKKIAKLLMNDPRFHYSIQELPKGAPDWAVRAVQSRELVAFVPNDQLNDMLSHAMHYIADLENTILTGAEEEKKENPVAATIDNARVAFREMQGLPKVGDLDTLQKKSLEWFKRGSKAAAKETYVDTKEIFDAGDGFKWFLLTSQKSYAREGKILQNCIGSHWTHSKTTGQGQSIVVMKRGNGETVVAARISNKNNEVLEMKGKNNQPPIRKYMPYVLEFINKRKLEVTYVWDFNRAGYYEIDGEWVYGIDYIGPLLEKEATKHIVIDGGITIYTVSPQKLAPQQREILMKSFNTLAGGDWYHSDAVGSSKLIYGRDESQPSIDEQFKFYTYVFPNDMGTIKDLHVINTHLTVNQLNELTGFLTNKQGLDVAPIAQKMFWKSGIVFEDNEWRDPKASATVGEWAIFEKGNPLCKVLDNAMKDQLGGGANSLQSDWWAWTKSFSQKGKIIAAQCKDGVISLQVLTGNSNYLPIQALAKRGTDDIKPPEELAAILRPLIQKQGAKLSKRDRLFLGVVFNRDGRDDKEPVFIATNAIKQAKNVSEEPPVQKIELPDARRALMVLYELNKKLNSSDLFLLSKMSDDKYMRRYPTSRGRYDLDRAINNITNESSKQLLERAYGKVPDAVFKITVTYGHGKDKTADVYAISSGKEVVLFDSKTVTSTWQSWDDYDQVVDQLNKFLEASKLKVAAGALPLGKEISRSKDGTLTTGSRKSQNITKTITDDLGTDEILLSDGIELNKMSNDHMVTWVRKIMNRVKIPGQGWIMTEEGVGVVGILFVNDKKIVATYVPPLAGGSPLLNNSTFVDVTSKGTNPYIKKILPIVEKEFGWKISGVDRGILNVDERKRNSDFHRALDVLYELEILMQQRRRLFYSDPHTGLRRINKHIKKELLYRLARMGLIEPVIYEQSAEDEQAGAGRSWYNSSPTPSSDLDGYTITNLLKDNVQVFDKQINRVNGLVGYVLSDVGKRLRKLFDDTPRGSTVDDQDVNNVFGKAPTLRDGWVKPVQKDSTPPKIVKTAKTDADGDKKKGDQTTTSATDSNDRSRGWKKRLAMAKFKELANTNGSIPSSASFRAILMDEPFNMSKQGAQTYYFNLKKEYSELGEAYSHIAAQELREELSSFKRFLIG